MLGMKKLSLKKLAKKVRGANGGVVDPEPAHNECLLKVKGFCEEEEEDQTSSSPNNKNITPNGFFALYIGEERQRHVVPTSYLCHPLFKMLLEKASDEFGFSQRNGLVVPCTVSTFHQVVNVIECNNGKFDLGKVFEEFVV